MRKFIFLLLLLPSLLLANDGVFVLVDVSRSFPNEAIKLEAKNIILELLQGRYDVQKNTGNWKFAPGISDQKISSIISGSSVPLFKNDDVLFIIPFGEKNRYRNYQWTRISNYPQDIVNFFNGNFPKLSTDTKTFINIAEAITVSLAPRFNIKDYYIFLMSDELNDQTGSQSILDQFEVDLITSWNNHVNSQCNNALTLERTYEVKGTTYRYFISVIKVSVLSDPKIKNVPDGLLPPALPPTSGAAAGGQNTGAREVKFTTYAGGKRNSPIEIKQEALSITWSCDNCPSDVTYTFQVQGIDGNKYKDKQTTSSNSISLHLKSGVYKIFVTADSPSGPSAGSDVTYIQVDSGGSLWFIWLLLLALVVVGGILYLQRMRQNKIRKRNSDDQY